MSFVGKVWKVLVGVKDGLVLLFMLLFFLAVFAILSARPNPGQVRDGALLIDLGGVIVEEKTALDPVQALLARSAPMAETRARDVVRALDAAAGDARIKAVVIDMTTFLGGGQVHLKDIGEAMDRVRQAKKPVFTYALGYADDHMLIAAHASEVWMDPQGMAVIAGPGGNNLYYAGLLEKLSVKARIYRVGAFKSAVEPYSRSDMSEEARANAAGLYGAMWEEYKANVTKARPKLQLARVTGDPLAWIQSSGGDMAKAAVGAGMVDKLGDYAQFGARVAQVAGEDPWDKTPGKFASSELEPFLADLGAIRQGKAIGVVTIAGEIVDGEAGPGTAGGTRIADLLDAALAQDLAALVVRVDSPGGSVTASEEIRRAVQRHRDRKIPVAVSFANVAASGGYWVATSSDRIFAEPDTITGSIGVFAVIPTFEDAAAKLGVTSDGYRTTELSGQPDFLGGFTPAMDALLQNSINGTYSRFLGRVSASRRMPLARVEEVAQGQVWDGGTARQIGLVDEFGGLTEALGWAAAKAGVKDGEWHPVFLGESDGNYDSLIRRMVTGGSQARTAAGGGDIFALLGRRSEHLGARISADALRLLGARGAQALCTDCPITGTPVAPAPRPGDDRAEGMIALLAWLAKL
ncbi:signal peptide peptidase SppA [Erythrobacter neustonensis]|uniref:Signal peptide peptidase SppA n=1 Tax=Erythrobacter neustonensis TaxID=1112 RepID=A0A192D1R4_9SPHN|nr:signal peptide peptidase SppA [Erythrobacter neustonensis]ANK11911.1 signal peptide peptidase SppA [Erythrobacter neustonensis]